MNILRRRIVRDLFSTSGHHVAESLRNFTFASTESIFQQQLQSGVRYLRSHKPLEIPKINIISTRSFKNQAIPYFTVSLRRSLPDFPMFYSMGRRTGITAITETFRLNDTMVRQFATKVKKYKLKAYSSYKERFKLLANGEYKRWKAGKRHNAKLKTNKQKRQLRKPTIVPHGLKLHMRKLNFSA